MLLQSIGSHSYMTSHIYNKRPGMYNKLYRKLNIEIGTFLAIEIKNSMKVFNSIKNLTVFVKFKLLRFCKN